MSLYIMESNKTVSSPWDRVSHSVLSFREALSIREPCAVDARCPGGAFGCPGDYFRGAPAADCRPLIKEQCDVCWAVDYQDEEWIDNDER